MAHAQFLTLFLLLLLPLVVDPRSFIPKYFDPRTWKTWLTLDGRVWTLATCSLQCQKPTNAWCNVFRILDNGDCAMAGMSGFYLEEKNNANGSLIKVYVDSEDYMNSEWDSTRN